MRRALRPTRTPRASDRHRLTLAWILLGAMRCTPYVGSASPTIDAATPQPPSDAATLDGHVDEPREDAAVSACDAPCVQGVCVAGRCVLPPQQSCLTPDTPGCGLVEIEAGSFTMGTQVGCTLPRQDLPCSFDGSPAQPGTRVDRFWLDANLVTVARFRAFRRAAAAERAAVRRRAIPYPGGASIAWDGVARTPVSSVTNPPCNWTDFVHDREAHPINCIDWWAAQEFCVWDGGRLPTGAEWEYAARGRPAPGLTPGRFFPWGDEPPDPDCLQAHWNFCTGDDGAVTRRVGQFAPSAGLYDMAGNLYQWTADSFAVYGRIGCWQAPGRHNPLCDVGPTTSRVLRGGSWGDYEFGTYLRSASRTVNAPHVQVTVTGFRCARSP